MLCTICLLRTRDDTVKFLPPASIRNPLSWISVLTFFGCFEGSRATGSVFQLFRKPGAVGSSTRKRHIQYIHTRTRDERSITCASVTLRNVTAVPAIEVRGEKSSVYNYSAGRRRRCTHTTQWRPA